MRNSCLPGAAGKKNKNKKNNPVSLAAGTRKLSNLRCLLLDRLLSSKRSWLNGWGDVDLCSLFVSFPFLFFGKTKVVQCWKFIFIRIPVVLSGMRRTAESKLTADAY